MEGRDYLRLKADLLVEGMRATPSALKDVGRRHKEQNHGLFGWDFEDHVGEALPDDFRLPDGTIVQFRKNSRSPYTVDRTGDDLVLYRLDEPLSTVSWLARPTYYGLKTSHGNSMVKIGQIGGQDCLFFCYQNYCSHFAKGKQCLFCNLVSTTETYDSVIRAKDVEDIGEVAAAAFAEGEVNHVLLTGGCFSREKEIELVGRILDSIREHTGLDRVPGTILPSPAKDREAIEAYYATGIQAIGFSMEIWDERLYQAICPGKAESTSHSEFAGAIDTATEVFGAGNVYGVFVMGLEPRKTLLEGVRQVTASGANVVPFVWSPNPGSHLEGHRAPTSDWFLDTVLEAAEIVYAGGVPAGTQNHCYKCDGNSLLHDALRLQGIE